MAVKCSITVLHLAVAERNYALAARVHLFCYGGVTPYTKRVEEIDQPPTKQEKLTSTDLKPIEWAALQAPSMDL